MAIIPTSSTALDRVAVAVRFPSTVKELCKIPYVFFFDWARVAGVPLTPYQHQLSHFFKGAKNFCSMLSLPSKALDIALAVQNFDRDVRRHGGEARPIADLFFKFVGLGPDIADSCSFLYGRDVLPITQSTASTIAAAGNGLSAVSATYGAVTECIDLSRASDPAHFQPKRVALHVINLIKNICYIALASLALVAFIFSITFCPWIMATLATVALVCALGGFFYDKICVAGDPGSAQMLATVTYLNPPGGIADGTDPVAVGSATAVVSQTGTITLAQSRALTAAFTGAAPFPVPGVVSVPFPVPDMVSG